MAALGNAFQQVMVIRDKKVISNSKHLVNVFKEAKAAYAEKKAELRAAKGINDPNRPRPQLTERESRRSHNPSASSSRNPSREAARNLKRSHTSHPPNHPHASQPRKPSMDRGYSDSIYDPSPPQRRASGQGPPRQSSGLRHETTQDDRSIAEDRRLAEELQRMELTRRHSSSSLQEARRASAAARPYGELPPPLPVRPPINQEQELKNKATALSVMLQEANCLQYSAKAIIKSLEKNPQQMAAVGLALAEISNLLTKMAPGALAGMKGAFPAVTALLLSPEFLIAAGVGVGITVVALGGYKIIKKIKAGGNETEKLTEAEELEEVSNVERIEHWRRAITDVDTASMTSVEGELMTPMAAAHYRSEGVLPPKDDKKDSHKKKEHRSKDSKSRVSSKAGSSRSVKNKSGKEKEKSPSGLRMLLKKM